MSFDNENDGVDTTTPLDGDGHNVTGLEAQFAPFDEGGNLTEDHYETRGRTVVKTPIGYRFASQDKNLPVITSAGLKVTADEAEALREESDGLVSVAPNETEED